MKEMDERLHILKKAYETELRMAKVKYQIDKLRIVFQYYKPPTKEQRKLYDKRNKKISAWWTPERRKQARIKSIAAAKKRFSKS